MDWKLFLTTFGLIFVAELPDKTAIAVLLMAARQSAMAVFVGAAAALTVQSVFAIGFGSLLSLLPVRWVHLFSGVVFLVFAVLMWVKKEEAPDPAIDRSLPKAPRFWKVAGSAFLVVFIAEWGDITQLATATLVAQSKSPWTIFISATLALCLAAGLAAFLGHSARKNINPGRLQKVAAVAFAIVGIVMLVRL